MINAADSATQEFQMKLSLGSLVLLLFSSIAFAQTVEIPSPAQIASLKAECEKKHVGATIDAVLGRAQCDLAMSITVLEFKERSADADKKMAASERAEIKKELVFQRTMLDSIEKSLKALAVPKLDQQGQGTQPILESASKVPVLPTQPEQEQGQAPPPQFTAASMGVPFQVIELPGRLAALTRDLPELTSRYEIVKIGQAGQHFLDQQEKIDMRVVVLKNGQPLAVSNPSAECGQNPRLPGCFTEFYADLNRDGQPELIPYKGIDPAFLNTVYVATDRNDRIELVYLLPVPYKAVGVHRLPIQIFWGNPVKVAFQKVAKTGRFPVTAYAANEQH